MASSLKSVFQVRKSCRISSKKKAEPEIEENKTWVIRSYLDFDHVEEPKSAKKGSRVMTAIKSIFPKQNCASRQSDETDFERMRKVKNSHPDSPISDCDSTSRGRANHQSNVSSQSGFRGDESPLTPMSPRTPHRTTPLSPAKQNTALGKSGITTEELTEACKRLLSPSKRKSSDNENENTGCSVSPVKSPRSSDESSQTTTPEPDRSLCKAFSPVRPRRTPSPDSPCTPKSHKKSEQGSFRVPTSTPRRLFSSPERSNGADAEISPKKPLSKSLQSPSKSPSLKMHRQSAIKPYQSAKRSLHTAKPDRLIGRDNEERELEDFICDKLDSGSSGSLYISGAPGTGKTALINFVIDKLNSEYGGLRKAFVNCMTLRDSNTVFSHIHEQLTGSPIKTKDAARAMERLFTTCDDCILLVLDEIDQLDNKHHHILYRIFEWPALENSKLILIGIANALDLTDRVLPRLQASKTCRPTLMHFPPYTSGQITDILKHRLERDLIVEPSAINFCARKVSAVAGDVRKALDVCRRAVEMVESDARCQQVLKPTDCNSPTKKNQSTPLKKVTISHISKVMSEVYGSSVTAANSSENDVPLQQKLAVCSLLVLVKNGKVKEVQLGKLHEAYTKVCKQRQIAPVNQSEFHSVLSLLDSRGVIAFKKAKDTRLTKVSLKLDEHELEQTLQDKALMASILKDGVPK